MGRSPATDNSTSFAKQMILFGYLTDKGRLRLGYRFDVRPNEARNRSLHSRSETVHGEARN